jgi:hypothetical protein
LSPTSSKSFSHSRLRRFGGHSPKRWYTHAEGLLYRVDIHLNSVFVGYWLAILITLRADFYSQIITLDREL